MTLSFSTKWPKKMGDRPPFFIPKIWMSIILSGYHGSVDHLHYYREYFQKFGSHWDDGWGFESSPKHHTIRFLSERQAEIWNTPERAIHFVINNRTKNRFQFAPTLPCTGLQELRIIASTNQIRLAEEATYLTTESALQLAKNDGFDSLKHFFSWFTEEQMEWAKSQNKKPYLIHWTDLKY